MFSFTRALGAAVIVALAGGPLSMAPALAQTAPATDAPTLVRVSGTIIGPDAGPLGGVTITLKGLKTYSSVTAADGSFTLNVPAGIYSAIATKSGYLVTTDPELAVTAQGATVNVQMQQATFSSLQTIGRVSTKSASNKAFNVTPSSIAVVSNQTIVDRGDIQVRNALNQTPGIISGLPGSVNTASSGAITFPNIRGALSFETAALIDGHPLSVGKFGDYVTSFLNASVFQSIETIKGPGSVTPEISRAIGGTVNFRTLDPTATPTGSITLGTDSYNGVFSNFNYSNTLLNGKLGVVLDYAVDGTPGAVGQPGTQYSTAIGFFNYTDSQGNVVTLPKNPTQPTVPGQNNQNRNAIIPVVAYGLVSPFTYTSKTELAKLKYNFSSVSSFTASYLGSQTWSDQNGNNGDYVPTNFAPGAAYNGAYPTGSTRVYSSPFSYGDEWEINNEPIFQGEFRTSFKNDNIFARYYTASISRLQTNGAVNPTQNSPVYPVQLYGTDGTGNALNGLDPYGKPYQAQETDGRYYFASSEEDRLHGYSFEYDHALGASGNLVSFSTDQNFSRTHAYTPGSSDLTASVPDGSTQDTATYLLRGQFAVTDKFNVTGGYYLTNFRSHFGSSTLPTPTSKTSVLDFLDQNIWHNDFRLGFQYRSDANTSLRASLGTAVAPPYLGTLATATRPAALCTGKFPYACPAGFNSGQAAVAATAGSGVLPETSFGFDIGFDHRLKADPSTNVTFDVYHTNLYNQFVSGQFQTGTFNAGSTTVPLFTSSVGNLSAARYEGIELGISRTPQVGFGYVAQGALVRGYATNVPKGGYPGGSLGIVNQANFTVLSVSNQAIPYSTGYFEGNFHTIGGGYVSLGSTYYGNNNGFGIPATLVFSGTLRFPIANKYTSLQVSADNLFNAYPSDFPTLFAGAGIPLANGQFSAGAQKNFGPRNVRISLTHKFGK